MAVNKEIRLSMRNQIIQRGIFTISVSCVALLTMGILSCVEPIKLDTFADKTVKKNLKSALAVSTVLYKYNDKIVFSWKKIRNATSYYLYEFKNKTGTLASKVSPDDIVGPNVTPQYIIKRKKSDLTHTCYVIVVARGSDGKVLVTSEMIEGKTFGKPKVQDYNIQETYYNVTFTWALIEGASTYAVERKEAGVPRYTRMNPPVQSADGNSWKFEDKNIKTESKYHYKVIAYVMNGKEVLAESNYEFSVQTPKQEAPFAVENFAVSKHAYSDRVLLVWDEPKKLAGFEDATLLYAIQRREKSVHGAHEFLAIETDMSPSQLKKPENPDLNFEFFFERENKNPLVYEDMSAELNKIYEYKVTATYVRDKKRGESGRPSVVEEGARIPQASNVLAEKTDGGVRVRWDMPRDFLEFSGTAEVHRSKGGLSFGKIKSDIAENKYEDTTADLETLYTYKVGLIASISDPDVVPSDLNKGVFSAGVNYEHQEEKEHNFEFTVSRNKRHMLKFSWTIPEGISMKAEDISIERAKNDGKGESKGDGENTCGSDSNFETMILSTNPILDETTRTGSAELSNVELSVSSFKPTLYRLVWKSNDVSHCSQAVFGDILRTPQNVSATKGEHAYIVVTWQPSLGAQKYEIEFREKTTSIWEVYQIDGKDFLMPQNANSGMQTVNFIPSNNDEFASRGIEYDIRIIAIGEDDHDREASIVVQGKVFGPAGMNVRATKGSSKEKITISWKAIDHAEEYRILRKMKGSRDEFTLARIPSEDGTEEYTYEDVVDNPHYLTEDVPDLEKIYFQIYEYSIAPKKRDIRSVMPSVKAEGYLLGSPSDIEASQGIYSDKIVVSWSHVGGASQYKIYSSEIANGYYEELDTVTVEPSHAIGDVVEYEDTSSSLRTEYRKYYKVTSLNDARLESRRTPDKKGFARGTILKSVPNVKASDVNDDLRKGIYIAMHGADSRIDVNSIDRKNGISYATKITWGNVSGAEKYYIYRMDFNESRNFWRKIGERTADEPRVFFDAQALILREYRAMYWVVASSRDKDDRWHFDASLEGDPKKFPRNTLISKLDFPRFDARKQTENIEAMSAHANIDVGSRWITPPEYLNWSLAVIGEGVYDLYDESSYKYGISHDGWGYIVNFTMNNYSLGAKAHDIRSSSRRQARKSTELVVNVDGALSGTFTDAEGNVLMDCPTGNGVLAGCRGATSSGRLGTYIGNNKDISVQSPYGDAQVRISGTGEKKYYLGFPYDVDTVDGLIFDFREGTITLRWLGENYVFSNNTNNGVRGPHVTPIRFNRSYDFFLRVVYDSGRE